ncbi:hypothetical protein ACWF9B_35550 [Streptomyces sp. NPDC055089]
MDRRLIQTAVFGSPESDDPAVCPETGEELEVFRRRHANDTIWCGTKFEGGCGRQLTTRLCIGRICHFAHYAAGGSGERCGRKAKGKDSANHLFAKAHLAEWLTAQGLRAEFSYPEPLGSAVLVRLEDARTLLLHLDRSRPVTWDENSWEIILGPGVPVTAEILEKRGYVQRIRFEDRPGGGRFMRLGTEQPGAGTTWEGLEDAKLTGQGLNTRARPDAVRMPMPKQREYVEAGGRSIVSISPTRTVAASAARREDPVKRVLTLLDRALRDQPGNVYSAVGAIRRLLEKEKSPENIGRLRLALERGEAGLKQRVQHRCGVLKALREHPTDLRLAEATQLMRDLDVTAAERETVRAARVQLHEEGEARQREQARLRAVREAEQDKKRSALAERRERIGSGWRARSEQTAAEQRERLEAAERQARQERAETLAYLAPFLLGALKKAAREKRATTWREIQHKTGQRELGRLTQQDKLAILEIVEKQPHPDAPLWSAVLAAEGSDDALRLHRDLLQRLRRPTTDDDAGLLGQVHAQCVRLSRPW